MTSNRLSKQSTRKQLENTKRRIRFNWKHMFRCYKQISCLLERHCTQRNSYEAMANFYKTFSAKKWIKINTKTSWYQIAQVLAYSRLPVWAISVDGTDLNISRSATHLIGCGKQSLHVTKLLVLIKIHLKQIEFSLLLASECMNSCECVTYQANLLVFEINLWR